MKITKLPYLGEHKEPAQTSRNLKTKEINMSSLNHHELMCLELREESNDPVDILIKREEESTN